MVGLLRGLRALGARSVETLRYAWLNLYALLALALGLVFVALVPQTREIFSNLVAGSAFLGTENTRNFHITFYLVTAATWGGAIWYSMRVLSSTRFPADPDPAELAAPWAKWMRAELPRLAAFFGLASLALCTSVFLEGAPTLRWQPVLSVGLVPLSWAFTHAADRAFARTRADAGLPHYPFSVLAVTLLSAALAISAWWSYPHEWKVDGVIASAKTLWSTVKLEPELSDWLLIASAAASVLGLVLHLALARRTAGSAAMLVSLFAWLAATGTAALEAQFLLPMALLLFAIFGLWWTSRRRRLHGFGEDDAARRVVEVGRATRRALAGTMVVLGLLVAGFSLFPIALGKLLGTLAIAFLALALWCFFGTVIWVFLPKRIGWASLALVPIAWTILLGKPADHELRGVEFAAPGASPERPGLAQHFDDWRGRLPDRDRSPIFFVAAAGGGLRAGYWTAHALAAMDDATCGEFGGHVYAYSGVSGGSLGIAAYLAQRKTWASASAEARCERSRGEEITQFLGRDFLAPVAGSLVFAETFQRFVPVSYLKNERGNALSAGWSGAWNEVFGSRAPGLFDQPFLEVFDAKTPADKKAAVMPAVFLNATGVNSGRRVLAANVIAPLPGVDDLFYAGGQGRDIKLKTYRLPLREAVLNSARFTYVSPAGTTIGCFPRKGSPDCDSEEIKVWDRLVDGGYFENSGLSTLTDVMRLLEADAPAAKRPFKNPVFLVIIDNGTDPVPACESPPKRIDLRAGMTEQMQAAEAERKRRLRDRAGIPRRPNGELPLMSETTAPIEAFLNVREARAKLEVRRVSAHFECPYVLDWSLFGSRREARDAKRLAQQPALGWFLSTRHSDWIVTRAKLHAEGMPFDLAACDDGKRPTRGLLGDPKLQVKCQPARH